MGHGMVVYSSVLSVCCDPQSGRPGSRNDNAGRRHRQQSLWAAILVRQQPRCGQQPLAGSSPDAGRSLVVGRSHNELLVALARRPERAAELRRVCDSF
jgi:hypothetical protein